MPEIGVPVRLVMVGTNHRHAPIEVREQLAAEDHGGGLVEALMRHEARGRGRRPLDLQPLRALHGRYR